MNWRLWLAVARRLWPKVKPAVRVALTRWQRRDAAKRSLSQSLTPIRTIIMDSNLYGYMFATIAAGFASRAQALPAKQIASMTDDVIKEFETRHAAREQARRTAEMPKLTQ